MAERRQYLMVSVQRRSGRPAPLTLSEVASRCGVHPELIERFVRLGLIDPVESRFDEPFRFRMEVVPLVRKIMRLRNHLGVNYMGVGVILELMSRIEELESRIRELEERLTDQ
jgi:MerR family transcriptional regulator, heat shock protein HspR